MSTSETILQLLISGLLGVTGQLVRVAVGMKKLNDIANEKGVKTQDLLVVSGMVISILIGFVTGILAWLSVSTFSDNYFSTKESIMGIIVAGYSGTDFIEGLISRYLPQMNGTQPAPNQLGNNDYYAANRPEGLPQSTQTLPQGNTSQPK